MKYTQPVIPGGLRPGIHRALWIPRQWLRGMTVLLLLVSPVFSDTSYHKKVDRELNEWNAKVESLQERSQKAGENTRQVLEKDTRELQAKLKEVRQALNDMAASGSEKSKPVRQGIENALKEIRNLYRTAVSHFKSSSDAKEAK